MIIKIDEILDSEIITATVIDKFLVYGFTQFFFLVACFINISYYIVCLSFSVFNYYFPKIVKNDLI